MSLITLNSNGQDPYFFSCHFPQPIPIKSYSQVCLLKFIHFRDSHVYNITTANNLLKFCIGQTRLDAIRDVRITPGQYTGDELATEIQTQMNSVLQQQHYEWTCTFTPEDATTSPPTLESFKISFASVATPAITAIDAGDMNQLADLLDLNTGEVDIDAAALPTFENSKPGDAGYIPNRTMMIDKGLLTNDGTFQVQNIAFSGNLYDLANPKASTNFGFDEFRIGCQRNELSALTNSNPNLVFNPLIQDLNLNFNANGLSIESLRQAGNTKLGNANYVSAKPCRKIESTHFKQIFTTNAYDDSVFTKFRLRVKYTLLASNRRIVVQLFKSIDNGGSYTPLADGEMGNDGQGNSFVKAFTASDGTVYQGAIWVSDKDEYNDLTANPAGGFTNNKVQNIFITRKCPYKPNLTPIEVPSRVGAPLFDDPDVEFEDAGSNEATFTPYAGANGYKYVLTIAGDATSYYLKEQLAQNEDSFKLLMSTADAPYAGNGHAQFDPSTDQLTITLNGGGAGPIISVKSGDLETTQIVNNPFVLDAILNPNDRPLTLSNVNDGSEFNYESELASTFQEADTLQAPDGGSDLGADISRPAILFLRQLTVQDVANNSGAPAYLTQGQTSGTMGTTLGAADNIVVLASSTGGDVFTSQMATQRVSKDTVLNISVPELAGIKSFNGIDQGAGSKLSGEAKNIAVLPREEFEQRGENAYGGLVYVAPFENWLDLNNGSEVYINQLSVEVRQPAGTLATDLRPDTICQIKFRQDPTKAREQAEDQRFEQLALAISSATQTGQILSQTMYNKGS